MNATIINLLLKAKQILMCDAKKFERNKKQKQKQQIEWNRKSKTKKRNEMKRKKIANV